MTNTEKMTNAKALAFVLENCTLPNEVSEKIQNIYNSTIKKSVNKKPTKTQEANKELAGFIKEVLSNSANPMTITEIQNADERLSIASGISNQKVTAIVRGMIENKEVVKTVDGKKSRFSLVTSE